MSNCGVNKTLFGFIIKDEIHLSRCCYLYSNPISLDFFLNQSLETSCKMASTKDYGINENKKDMCDGNCELFEEVDTLFFGCIHTCNLSCYHCCAGFDHSEESPHKEYTPKEEISSYKDKLFKFLDKIKDETQIKHLILDATGEIFIYYNELVSYLRDNKDHFGCLEDIKFLTNATLLSKERIKELSDLSQSLDVDFIFNVSLDSLKASTHLAIRHIPVNKILKTIIELRKYFQVIVCFTIKEFNKDEVEDFDNFFKKKNIPVQYAYDMFEPALSKYMPSTY